MVLNTTDLHSEILLQQFSSYCVGSEILCGDSAFSLFTNKNGGICENKGNRHPVSLTDSKVGSNKLIS